MRNLSATDKRESPLPALGFISVIRLGNERVYTTKTCSNYNKHNENLLEFSALHCSMSNFLDN